MARGYRTSQPQFVNDMIYQPPYELIQQAMAMQQQGYDTALTQTDALNGMLNILHRNSEADTAAANEIKNYYGSQIDEITGTIQRDPANWRKNLNRIRNLQREIQQDRTSGRIAKLEGTYNAYSNWQKQMQELKEKNPAQYNAAVVNAASRTFDKNWGGDSINNGVWKAEDIINQPDIFNAKDTLELIKQVPAFKDANSFRKSENGYIITMGDKTENVSEERLLQLINGAAFSNPNMMSYLNQQQRFGLAQYFDETGNLIAPYRSGLVNSVGDEVTQEEYNKMTSAEKASVRKSTLYTNNPLGKVFSLASPMSYASRTEADLKVQEDVIYSKALDRQHDTNMARLNHQLDIARDNNNYTNEINKLMLTGEITPQQAQSDILTSENLIPFTPEELQEDGDKFSKYLMKEAKGEELTPEQREEFDTLKTRYAEVAKDLNMTPREVMLIHAIQNDPNFGKVSGGDELMIGLGGAAPTTGRTYKDTPERKEALAALAKYNKTNKGIKDWNTNILNLSTNTYVGYKPSRQTEIGKQTYALADAALMGSNVKVYNGDVVLTDKHGKIDPKKLENLTIDTKMFDGWAGDTAGASPIQYLVSQLGGSPTDYIDNMVVDWDNDKMIVRGTLRIPENREDDSLFGGLTNEDLEGFRGKKVAFVTDRVNNESYNNAVRSNTFFSSPQGTEWLAKQNRSVKATMNRVDRALSEIPTFNTSTKLYPNITVTSNGNNTYSINNFKSGFTQQEIKFLMYNLEGLDDSSRKEIIKERVKQLGKS